MKQKLNFHNNQYPFGMKRREKEAEENLPKASQGQNGLR